VTQYPTTPPEPIVVNSVSSNIDYENNTADFTDITVSQGDTRLTAERARATGVGFTDSQWVFAGRVVIVLEPRGSLSADQATLQFRNGKLTQVIATGSPVSFEQRRTDSRRPGHGHADQITYDAEQDTVSLFGHPQLSDGSGVEISAPAFVYSVRDERLQGDSPGERRGIHATFTPK
jgi:lipopolysaccharide transport protein LptA